MEGRREFWGEGNVSQLTTQTLYTSGGFLRRARDAACLNPEQSEVGGSQTKTPSTKWHFNFTILPG